MDVPALADAAQTPPCAARGFTRRQPEPTGKFAPATKRVNVATAPTSAVAVSTPTPGIVWSRVATGCALAICAS